MSNISANDLKTKGGSAIEAVLEYQPKSVISVRGKDRFVVSYTLVFTDGFERL